MISLDRIIISDSQPIGSNSLWIKPIPQKNGITQMAFYVPYDKNKYTEVVSSSAASGSGNVALDFDKLNLGYDSEDKKIKFTFPVSETATKDFEIDCADFIKDGMVNDVQFSEETGKISITFNTDSGKNSIELDAYKMFESLSGEDELLDGGNIVEFRDLMYSSQLIPSASYKVLYFDTASGAFDEDSYPTADSSPYAFHIKVTALSPNTIHPEVKVLPQEDGTLFQEEDLQHIESISTKVMIKDPTPLKVEAYGKLDVTKVLLNSSLNIELWEFGNNIKLCFNPYLPSEYAYLKVNYENPFLNYTNYYKIIKNWSNIRLDGDVKVTDSEFFLHNINIEHGYGIVFNGDADNINIQNLDGSDIRISGKDISIYNSFFSSTTSITGYRIKLNKVTGNKVTINGQDITLVNFYEALGISTYDIMEKMKYNYTVTGNNIIRAYISDYIYVGYIELKSDLSDLSHIQTYWDGSNLIEDHIAV